MKLGPFTELGKRNKAMSKKFDDDVISVILTSLSFFRFMANLKQSGSRIPNAESTEITFSLKVTFYRTKTENRTKKSLIQLSPNFCQKS